jgi:autotransporter-associated beta strand protein
LPQINQNSGSAVVINAPLNLDVTTVLGGAGSGLVDISSVISGPWQGLTINSPATWRLSGNSTYSGATTVQAGTLSCSQAASLGSGALKISNGAVVNLNYSGTRTISALTLGGTNMPAGVYGSSNSPAIYQDAHFSGTGTVTVPSSKAKQ